MSKHIFIVGFLLALPSLAAAQPLPSPWSNQDVGSTGAAGSASYSSGTFTVSGSGVDIWDTADAFQFVYQPLSGDGQIVARVLSVQNTNTFAKAGVMLRETLTPESRHVILDVRPGGEIEFMTRQAAGGATQFVAGATQPVPAWLKLVRTGSSIVASVSVDGTTWQQTGTTTFGATGLVYVGLVVMSHVAGTLNTSTFDSVAVTTASCGGGGLPGPWADQDVGVTGQAGCASYSTGVFTVAGAGADIWGTADSFHFMSQPVSGDAQIVAHVTSLQDTNTYAKAGIMWRDTFAAGSSDVILDMRPGGAIEFMTRSATGAATTFVASGTQPPPAWLKLTRSGSTITGAISSDGRTWTPIGTASPTMGANANVGIAVTSHDTSTLTIATFDGVAVTGAGCGGALPAPWVDQDVGVTGLAGCASYSGGVVTLAGAGADIWGTADAFHFMSQPVSGDAQIVARVTSLQDTSTFAKAGIMFRETLAAESSDVILDVRPGGAIEFMTRSAAGAATTFIASGTQTPPAWLKLTRSGSTITGAISSDGTTWTPIGTASPTMGASANVGVAVTSHDTSTLSTATFDSVAVATASCGGGALPGPWVDQDVGVTGQAGCASYSTGVFTVAGAGADIWGTADSFHFMSQPVSGDAQMVAHVTSLRDTNTYAKAGIMWRDTFSAGSSDVILDVRPGGAIEFMTRSATGAATTFVASGTQPPPAWLKLTRSGSTITGAISSDGTTWTPIGTASPTMGASANVGLAVTSHDTSALNTATFDNVTVTAAGPPPPGTATVVGALRSYSTIYSIGVEWDITGDTNHNASAQTEYRPTGQSAWNLALPLVRVDFNGANMLAGSVMFLQPNTSYDVRLTITDPDGGGAIQTVTLATRRVPAPPTSGRIFHAIPGSGGGDGSTGNPFQGIAAAQAVVVPGDTVLLHAGSYGGRIQFDHAGTTTNYIAWKAAGDGEVSISGIDVAAGHIWLEGLTIRNQPYGVLTVNSPGDVVVERCGFFGNHYAIYLNGAGANWYIADNTIVGDTPFATESLDGEGIELGGTSGHSVAYNSITNVADGISSPVTNVDIFGNDIFDTSDDGIEADGGLSNVRIWGNRIHNAVHNGISFQPQAGAPWYIIRNQIVGNKEAAFKFRTTDRFVMLHNTIVNWGNAYPGDAMMCCNEDHMMHGISRNNLWVSIQGGQIWGFDNFTKDWRADLDVDGFDWGSASNPFTYGGVVYPNLASFAAASGLETHGLRVAHSTCFETFNVPNPPPSTVPPQVMTLTAGCNAVDAGVVLPNVDDAFTGAAPDLGAFERGGVPPPSFGPR